MIEIILKDLKSITGEIHHDGLDIPNEIRELLKETFNAKELIQKNNIPEDTLGMFIPKINLVINIDKFSWELVKLITSFWVSILSLKESSGILIGTSIPIVDAIKELKNNIAKLSTKKGETCVYLSILKKSKNSKRIFKTLTISKQKVWDKHKKTKKKCAVKSCEFYNKKCLITKKGFDDILKSLVRKNIIIQNEKGICVKL